MLKRLSFLSCAAILVVVILTTTVMAQESPRYRKKTVIDFEDVLLEGELKKPAGAYITERHELSFKNLIKTRKNFEQEMFRSVDALK